MADLDQLETRRLQLEENVAKLRKSLQHWRTWDVEYEGLKEELEGGASVESEADCTRISNDFAGELVTEKEIFDLFGVGKGSIRQPSDVIRLIDRRLDYVQQNVATISKQVNSIETQLSEILEEFNRETENPETSGLPMTEIIEELDEDGNIISSKVTQPESATAQIIDTLRKAGLTDVDNSEKSSDQDMPEKDDQQASTNGKSAESLSDSKKSVKFAENVQERTIPSASDDKKSFKSTPMAKSPLAQGSFNSNERVIELDDDDEMIGAVIPEDESPEDARLRREMLQYNLNEVGQVVAELDLDENLSDFEDDDYDFEDEYDSEISEEEDEHGRSIRPGVSKDYRQQMVELEEKLKDRVIGNLGPLPGGVDPVMDPDGFRRLVVRQEKETSKEIAKPETSKGKTAVKETPAKKGVRFSETLDVQEAPKAPEPPKQSKPSTQPKQKTGAPIADIIERTPSKPDQAPAPPTKPAKQSRFKQSRNTSSNPEPSSSSDAILSQTIVERPNVSSSAKTPSLDEDEFDPELQQRQLASEYYRMRNNIIREQGGFKATEEELEDPLMEEKEDGKVGKVSRFKAARMKF